MSVRNAVTRGQFLQGRFCRAIATILSFLMVVQVWPLQEVAAAQKSKPVLQPSSAIVQEYNDLSSFIETLPDSTLNKGQRNSLLSKLRNSLAAYQRGKPCTAANILNAFLNETAAMKRQFGIAQYLNNLAGALRHHLLASLPPDFKCSIADTNAPPVADAGPDQTVKVGATVTLDGSASNDADGDPLTFKWSFVSIPEGSAVALSGPATVNPTFVIDKPGTYVVQLIVNDGHVDGAPDTVSISTQNSPPVASAGPDQTKKVTEMVTLDGSKSSDVDGDLLRFSWSFVSVPEGSTATLSDATKVMPTFVVDKPGTYVIQLIVNDGAVDSAPDTVIISTENSPPVAEAGPNQSVHVGDVVTLDGSGSSDLDGDPLTYSWSVVSKPPTSGAVLSSPASQHPSLTVDKAGVYVIQLIVNDGKVNSEPDTVTVTTFNTPPVADAGQDQNAFVGQTVVLDGGGSYDIDGDPITYGWSFTSIPLGSAVTLSDQTTVNPAFTPDTAGLHVVQLIVNDGKVDSQPDTASVSVTVAECQPGATRPCYEGPQGTLGIGQCKEGLQTCGPDYAFGSCVGQVLPGDEILNNGIDEDCNGLDAQCMPGSTQPCYTGPAGTEGVGICRAGTVTCDANGVYGECVGQILPLAETPDNGIDEDCDGRDAVTQVLPPDPVTVAPPIDQTVATTVHASTAFLYTGSNPIQTGVAPGTIELKRAAVLRGKVMDREGNPLPGMTITILNHPEFGQTLSRADGMFDMAVNGGGYFTVKYEKIGFFPAQRQVQIPWQDYTWLPDVIMMAADPQVTTVELISNEPVQVARGTVQTDADGVRQATILFPQGTQATMVMPDGSTAPLTTLTVRATEYTVGPNGLKLMPAELPPTSGYTYAVELSADEAITAGAKTINFNQPLYFYVDNFLGFPVGLQVPVGYYDRDRGVWVPSPDGRVIKIVGISGQLADIDTNGDNVPDNDPSLGIAEQERAKLATLYNVGQSLWRAPIYHFSTYDLNYGVGPVAGAGGPGQSQANNSNNPNPSCSFGSIIECENRSIGEVVGVVGTPFALRYQSDRTPGYKNSFTLNIPVSGETVPSPLKRIDLNVTVAGRTFTQTFVSAPNQSHTFTWDGFDGFQRELMGGQSATVLIDYIYDGFYNRPPSHAASFGLPSGSRVPGDIPARQEVSLSQKYTARVGTWSNRSAGLGLWSLNIHHAYDPVAKVLYFGNGRQKSAESVQNTIDTSAGNGTAFFDGDGGPADKTSFSWPSSVAIGPDGSLYVLDYINGRVRKIGPDGIVSTVAGGGSCGPGIGDNGPATSACLGRPQGIALGPDGSLYIADSDNHRIRRVDKGGFIATLAGTGIQGYGGDGGPATQAYLNWPNDVAVGSDGSVYFSDGHNNRIRRVGTDGIITTTAGGGSGYRNDVPATQVSIFPSTLDVAKDGSVYLREYPSYHIHRIAPDGIITTFVGGGSNPGDGIKASEAAIGFTGAVAVGPDGSVYLRESMRIRRVGTDGIVTTVAGNGKQGFEGDTGPATAASVFDTADIAVSPDGSVYLAEHAAHRIRRVAFPLPALTPDPLAISSDDGSEVYVFSSAGRHLETRDVLTGTVKYAFSYNQAGQLTQITDADNNVTTIERDGIGNPMAIVAPFGQLTILSVDSNGYLASIINPAKETTRMAYTRDGLLASFTDPNGNTSTMEYDAMGLLRKDQNAAGGFWQLASERSPQISDVFVSSALGRRTRYLTQYLSTGDVRDTTTHPDQTSIVRLTKTDGTTETTAPDGTITTVVEGPDPLFGMQAPVQRSLTITVPDTKLVYTSATTRTATKPNQSHPLGIQSITETKTVNSRVFTTAFDFSTLTRTRTSPFGRQTTEVLDAKGLVIETRVPGIEPVKFTYDANGRLSSALQGSRTISLAYDTRGNLSSITDPLLRTVSFDYDLAERVTQQTFPDARDVNFDYDQNGNLTSLTPPGRPSHGFTHNEVNMQVDYVPPAISQGPSTTTNSYNLDKEPTTITRPDGSAITFGYNPAGKLNSATIGRGHYSFTYNATTGNLERITSPDGITLTYSRAGFLLTGASWAGAVTGNVGYTYNNNFWVTSQTVNGGNSISFAYDADGLMTGAGDLAINRNAQNGLLTGTALGNMTDSFTYNSYGEVSQYIASYGGSPILSVQYDRDELGRIIRKTETIGNATSVYEYGYDLAGRLNQVKKDSAVISEYTYDPNGNRLSLTTPSGTVAGTYDDQDRLLSYGTFNYTHSLAGELKSKKNESTGATTNYVYDELGNLVSVTMPDGTLIEYVIDGQNRRIGKRVNGALVQGLLYEGQLRPVAELDGSNNIVSRFVYANKVNVPEYMIKGGVTYRIITDHLGSPRLVVNVADGSIVQRIDYDEFGNVILDTNPGFQPFGFAGGLFDQNTKLTRFGARDYDAQLGKWTSKDPIGFLSGDANIYEYVRSSPANSTDPSGLSECSEKCDKLSVLGIPALHALLEKLSGPGAEFLSKLYYFLTDARFVAFGKYSTVLVPALAGTIATVIEPVIYAYGIYELYKYIKENYDIEVDPDLLKCLLGN